MSIIVGDESLKLMKVSIFGVRGGSENCADGLRSDRQVQEFVCRNPVEIKAAISFPLAGHINYSDVFPVDVSFCEQCDYLRQHHNNRLIALLLKSIGQLGMDPLLRKVNKLELLGKGAC